MDSPLKRSLWGKQRGLQGVLNPLLDKEVTKKFTDKNLLITQEMTKAVMEALTATGEAKNIAKERVEKLKESGKKLRKAYEDALLGKRSFAEFEKELNEPLP